MVLERACMSDRIRRVLAERIIAGQYAPGERLVEMRIAEEFRTSQAPVREALRELETLRLVESEPYRGTRVREVGEREMAEAYAVRAVLEQAAAEVAAPILKGNVEKLRLCLDELKAVALAGDQDGYAHHNLNFHRQIIQASDNKILLQTWDSLGFEIRVRISLARQVPDLVPRAASHDPILEALNKGDGPTAGRLLREHAESFMSAAPARTLGVDQVSSGSEVD
jgi:DNA-binding GntR family transcriptional regulator